MPTTIDQLKLHGQPISAKEASDFGLQGIWKIHATKVVALEDGIYIRKGKTYIVEYLDVCGENPGTVHLLEAGLWWNVSMFEIK